MTADQVGGVCTTELCDISCVMCHFHGPLAPRKSATISPEQALEFMRSIPRTLLWFSSHGEFFVDPNALVHIRNAASLGHQPAILTNGQSFTPQLIDELLEIGVRFIRFSVDAYDPETYRKIRRGGELSKIVDACRYLRSRKRDYPSLRVEVTNVLFKKTFTEQARFLAFWEGLVDAVNFNAEYYNTFRFRNTFIDPGERVDCHLQLYLLPTGHMSPCCAISVHQHAHNLDWLPHISDSTPEEALHKLQGMYDTPGSPLAKVCENCDWWILWKRDEHGNSPYYKVVSIDDGIATWPAPHDLLEMRDCVQLNLFRPCNDATRTGDRLNTPKGQWWYAATHPLPNQRESEPIYVRIDGVVEKGAVGIGLVDQDNNTYIGSEVIRRASEQPAAFYLTAPASPSPRSIVIRNVSTEGSSTLQLTSIRAYRLKPPSDRELVSIEAAR